MDVTDRLTAEHYVTLIRAAGVEKEADLRVITLGGPAVFDRDEERGTRFLLVFQHEEQTLRFNDMWPEIEEALGWM
jgi:ssDNA-binding replication factor A large subunit